MSQELIPVGSFVDRVRALRDAWEERRQLESLATHHDFVRQYRLLLILHGWCAEALAQLGTVYGPSLELDISPRPAAAGEDTGFQVTVAGAFSLAFAVTTRSREREARWSVSVRQRVSFPADNAVSAGPPRGRWSRARVEDMILVLLSAYERSRSGGPPVESMPTAADDRAGPSAAAG